jgi:hypothetical protein
MGYNISASSEQFWRQEFLNSIFQVGFGPQGRSKLLNFAWNIVSILLAIAELLLDAVGHRQQRLLQHLSLVVFDAAWVTLILQFQAPPLNFLLVDSADFPILLLELFLASLGWGLTLAEFFPGALLDDLLFADVLFY